MKKIDISKKSILFYTLTVILVIIGDQWTKVVVDQTLRLGESHAIVDGLFYFTYIHNKGAAWGMFQGYLNFFFIVSLIAAVGIIYFFYKTEAYQKFYRFGLVLVLSGLVGNLIDRVVFGYVRDFIDFIIVGYDFPIFNIADMAIVIGVGLIILEVGIEEYQTWKISKSSSTNQQLDSE